MPDRRQSRSEAAAALAELASVEAAELKDRHKAREAAIRSFDAAGAAIADAEAALTTARRDQALAVNSLLETGLDTNTVGALLGLDARRVREARSVARGPKDATGAGSATSSE